MPIEGPCGTITSVWTVNALLDNGVRLVCLWPHASQSTELRPRNSSRFASKPVCSNVSGLPTHPGNVMFNA